MEFHDFLINNKGESLSSAGKAIPVAKEHIESFPETKATFKANEIPGVDAHVLRRVHFEFIGTWPLHTNYKSRNNATARYVNPDYPGVEKYTDLMAECECGKSFTQLNDTGIRAIRDEDLHRDNCLPQFRAQTRARLYKEMYQRILRLTRLGWHGTTMAPRLACSSTGVWARTRSFGMNMKKLRDDYRRIAGNTFIRLVREFNVDVFDLKQIYGRSSSTLRRWARKYATYEENESYELVHGEDGRYIWRVNEDNRHPEWVKQEVES